MAEDRNLNVSITAKDLASAQIKYLETQLQGLLKTIGAISDMTSAQAATTVAAVGQQVAARRTLLNAIREEQAAIDSAAKASAAAAAKAIDDNLRIARSIAEVNRQRAATAAEARLQTFESALGPSPGRRISSASASGAVFASDLGSMAALDAGVRDAATAAAVAERDMAESLTERNAVARATAEATARQIAFDREQALAVRYNIGALTELGVAAEASAAAGSRASMTLMGIQPRRFVSIFDETMRGQRGAMTATIGAMLKDTMGGASGLALGMTGLVTTIAGVGIVHGAEHFGQLAQETRAAAEAAGIALPQYSQLQGALQLSGLKATDADSSMRLFAMHLGEALANPASKAAQAFHNLGVSQEFLKDHANDTFAIFLKLVDAQSQYATTASKAGNLDELLGRSLSHLLTQMKSAKDLTDAMSEARQKGMTIDEQADEQLEQTMRVFEGLGHTFSGSVLQAFVSWAPEIRGVATALGNVGTAATNLLSDIGSLINKFVNDWPTVTKVIENTIKTANPLAGLIAGGPGWGYRALTGGGSAPAKTTYGAGEPIPMPSPQVNTLGSDSASSGRTGGLIAPALGLQPQQELQAKAAYAGAKAFGDPAAIEQAGEALVQIYAKIYGEEDARTKAAEEEKVKAVQDANAKIATEQKKAADGQKAIDNAQLRLQIAGIKGNIGAITTAWSEYVEKVKALYGQDSAQFILAQAQKVQAVSQATEQMARSQMQAINQSADVTRLLMESASLSAPKVGGGANAPSLAQQQGGFTNTALTEVSIANQQIAAYQKIANAASSSAAVQNDANLKIMQIAVEAQKTIKTAMDNSAKAAKEAAAAMTKPFIEFFTSITKQAEQFNDNVVDALLTHKKGGVQQAERQLVMGLINDSVKGVEGEVMGAASGGLAQLLGVGGKAGAGGIGSVLGTATAKLFGIGTNEGKDSAQEQLNTQTIALTNQFKLLGTTIQALAQKMGVTAPGSVATGGPTSLLQNSSSAIGGTQVQTDSSLNQFSSDISQSTSALNLFVPGLSKAVQGITSFVSSITTSISGLTKLFTLGASFLPAFSAGGIVSAQGGMVVGGTGGTLSLLHPNEMVLPAQISTGLQRMIGGGNTGGGGSSATLNIGAVNAQSFLAMINNPGLMRGLATQLNRYLPKNPSAQGAF